MADYIKQVNVPISFRDISTNTPTSWTWNFGDGTTATTKDVTKTYTAIGTYSLQHSAANSCGTGTCAAKTIQITEQPPPPVISPWLIFGGLMIGAVGLYFVTKK